MYERICGISNEIFEPSVGLGLVLNAPVTSKRTIVFLIESGGISNETFTSGRDNGCSSVVVNHTAKYRYSSRGLVALYRERDPRRLPKLSIATELLSMHATDRGAAWRYVCITRPYQLLQPLI